MSSFTSNRASFDSNYGLYREEDNSQLSVDMAKVEIEVKGKVATIRQSLRWKHNSKVAADLQLYLPMSYQASLSELDVCLKNTRGQVEIQDNLTAREQFALLKKLGHQSALVSQENPQAGVNRKDCLKIQLANVPPNIEVFATLIFHQEIKIDSQSHLYIPLKITHLYERVEVYTNADLKKAKINDIEDLLEAMDSLDQRAALSLNCNFIPTHQWEFQLRIHSPEGGFKWHCPSHPVLKPISGLDERANGTVIRHFGYHQQLKRAMEHPASFNFYYSEDHRPLYRLEASFWQQNKSTPYAINLFIDQSAFEPVKASSRTQEMQIRIGEYIFVIDRSGSMSGPKIDLAKRALKHSLKVLPSHCYFNVVSFGNDFAVMFPESRKLTSSAVGEAVSLIDRFSADLGGTELLKPIKAAFAMKSLPGVKQFVVVLTDGQVNNPRDIFAFIRENRNSRKVFAIGIGTDFSEELVIGIADAGGGNWASAVYADIIPNVVLDILGKTTADSSIGGLSISGITVGYSSHAFTINNAVELGANEEFNYFALISGISQNHEVQPSLSFTLYGKNGAPEQIKILLDHKTFSLNNSTHKMVARKICNQSEFYRNGSQRIQSLEESVSAKREIALANQICTEFTSFLVVFNQTKPNLALNYPEDIGSPHNLNAAISGSHFGKRLIHDDSIAGSGINPHYPSFKGQTVRKEINLQIEDVFNHLLFGSPSRADIMVGIANGQRPERREETALDPYFVKWLKMRNYFDYGKKEINTFGKFWVAIFRNLKSDLKLNIKDEDMAISCEKGAFIYMRQKDNSQPVEFKENLNFTVYKITDGSYPKEVGDEVLRCFVDWQKPDGTFTKSKDLDTLIGLLDSSYDSSSVATEADLAVKVANVVSTKVKTKNKLKLLLTNKCEEKSGAQMQVFRSVRPNLEIFLDISSKPDIKKKYTPELMA